MKTSSSSWRLWRVPVVLALLTGGGLVSALLGDGWWDALSWIALAVPLVIALWLFRPVKVNR